MSDITNVTAVETHDTQELTSKQVFEQINKIREDNAHIFDALRQLETVKSEGPQDIGAHGRAQGIADVVKCRETTNQRLLDFYERAYNDLREQEQQAKKRLEPESEDMAKRRKEFLDFVKETTTVVAGSSMPGTSGQLPDFDKIWKNVFLGE